MRAANPSPETIDRIFLQIFYQWSTNNHSVGDLFDDRQLFANSSNDGGEERRQQQQSTSRIIPDTDNDNGSQTNLKGEFEALQLLTQYIGPPKQQASNSPRDRETPSSLIAE